MEAAFLAETDPRRREIRVRPKFAMLLYRGKEDIPPRATLTFT